MSSQLDINDVVNGLLDQIAQQARQIAMLNVQLQIAQSIAESDSSEPEGGE